MNSISLKSFRGAVEQHLGLELGALEVCKQEVNDLVKAAIGRTQERRGVSDESFIVR